jgi:hypothetical protein
MLAVPAIAIAALARIDTRAFDAGPTCSGATVRTPKPDHILRIVRILRYGQRASHADDVTWLFLSLSCLSGR